MKIVMLCSKSTSSAIVYNELNKNFDLEKVIVEDSVSRKVFIKRRIKKLGFFRVMGQIIFSILIVPALKKSSTSRKKEILEENGLDDTPTFYEAENALFVDSVNSQQCIDYLSRTKPDIVVVNGTRIISKEVLECTEAVFINMHAGITPKYRGAHGAYWALCNNDEKNAGVTVHIVDTGIDTGKIIYQSPISISEKDNFTTYPLLQTAVGIKLEIQAINDIINNQFVTISNDLPSGLYYHPTAWFYIYNRIKKKIK